MESKQKIVRSIITIGIVGLVLIGTAHFAVATADKQAREDCAMWEQQAKLYHLFFITKAQKSECDSVGMIINAPVK